jgi:hypothetical protein
MASVPGRRAVLTGATGQHARRRRRAGARAAAACAHGLRYRGSAAGCQSRPISGLWPTRWPPLKPGTHSPRAVCSRSFPRAALLRAVARWPGGRTHAQAHGGHRTLRARRGGARPDRHQPGQPADQEGHLQHPGPDRAERPAVSTTGRRSRTHSGCSTCSGQTRSRRREVPAGRASLRRRWSSAGRRLPDR